MIDPYWKEAADLEDVGELADNPERNEVSKGVYIIVLMDPKHKKHFIGICNGVALDITDSLIAPLH